MAEAIENGMGKQEAKERAELAADVPGSGPTSGQTVGPFFGMALPYPGGPELVPPGSAGAIRLHGRVLDGRGHPVPDALLELWQTGPDGAIVAQEGSLHRDGWTFTGWGRADTDRNGHYTFSTLRPGRAGGDGAPFFTLTVFARGLLDGLHTRIYLPADEPSDEQALAADPLLASLAAERRDTLLAVAEPQGYLFDVRLQGGQETVFLTHRGSTPASTPMSATAGASAGPDAGRS